jgi:hypothetical protein
MQFSARDARTHARSARRTEDKEHLARRDAQRHVLEQHAPRSAFAYRARQADGL